MNATLAVLLDRVAAPIVGADGTAGAWKYGPLLAVLVPMAFVAVKVTEYTLEFANPVTVIGEVVPDAVATTELPRYTLAVIAVIGLPPSYPVINGICTEQVLGVIEVITTVDDMLTDETVCPLDTV